MGSEEVHTCGGLTGGSYNEEKLPYVSPIELIPFNSIQAIGLKKNFLCHAIASYAENKHMEERNVYSAVHLFSAEDCPITVLKESPADWKVDFLKKER